MLIGAVLVALFPVALIVMDSFKTTQATFTDPFSLPHGDGFTFDSYSTVTTQGNFGLYYLNSTIVTVTSVVLVLILSSLAAFGISEYKVRFTPAVLAVFVVGVMLPVRLGTVALLQMMSSLHLVNTLVPLICIYVAASLPTAVVLMTAYMRSVPNDIKEAARMDGANELRVFGIVLPLTRPGLAAVACVTMLPVWNDLWFPLIFAPGEKTQTVTLGVQQFIGQFGNNWGALLAALTLGAIPLILLFVIFSRQFIAGLTQGVGK
ncbi:carbohydrate ABC transporter permease [Streptomyces griseorubiginosus]|uniref:carbohydrate ABC transporter permease n=1 Tax=Streptomyces griseorubiginosus TaxID=67304 RepID=UPI003688BB50